MFWARNRVLYVTTSWRSSSFLYLGAQSYSHSHFVTSQIVPSWDLGTPLCRQGMAGLLVFVFRFIARIWSMLT
jgi:hypothetical protein